jgi:hypothetical protein
VNCRYLKNLLARGSALMALWVVSPAEFSAAEEPAATLVRKVLFIGIDGCRFDAVQAANTPHLDKLIEEGCHADNCLILGDRYQGNDTISGPGWSSILCGVWADKHGVQDNTFKGRNYDEYPHFFHRLKEASPQAYTASLVTWVPIQQFIVSSADIGKMFIPLNGDYVKADAQAAKSVVKVLAERDPTALFFYIGQVDETGHKHGFHPSVKPYIEAIETADKHVGEVVEALRARPTFANEQWLILVTSDHGGKGTGHGGGHKEPEILNSFLIVSGPAAKRGKLAEQTYLVDAPCTALSYLGKLDPAWKLDGRAVGLKD